MLSPELMLASCSCGTCFSASLASMISFRKVASIDPALVFRG